MSIIIFIRIYVISEFQLLPCWPVNNPQSLGGRCVARAFGAPGVIVTASVTGHKPVAAGGWVKETSVKSSRTWQISENCN